jgi:hypothetical protein
MNRFRGWVLCGSLIALGSVLALLLGPGATRAAEQQVIRSESHLVV